MSFTSKSDFESYKATGNMPKGGLYPDFQSLSTAHRDTLLPDERAKQVEQLIEIFHEHPIDSRVLRRVEELVNRSVPRAEMHTEQAQKKLIAEALE